MVSIPKIGSKKAGTFIVRSRKFYFLKLCFISINLPPELAWNTFVMSRLVLFAAVR